MRVKKCCAGVRGEWIGSGVRLHPSERGGGDDSPRCGERSGPTLRLRRGPPISCHRYSPLTLHNGYSIQNTSIVHRLRKICPWRRSSIYGLRESTSCFALAQLFMCSFSTLTRYFLRETSLLLRQEYECCSHWCYVFSSVLHALLVEGL